MTVKNVHAEEELAPASNLKPRDRLLVAAREMFHQHGINSVGVEAIIEAADTNKMTLYRHFGSKEDLIVRCLQKAVDESLELWNSLEARYPGDPKGQLKAWVERGVECIMSDKRGCEIANAAVELADGHPGRRVIEDGKMEHRKRFLDLCERAGLAQPELAAETLWLLLEGARISRQSEGAEGPSARFRRMAQQIIAAYDEAGHG